MPVSSARWMIALAPALVALMPAAPAMAVVKTVAAPIIINHASQLSEDRRLKKLSDGYVALSGAYVVYDQCDKELGIPPDEKTYLHSKFRDVSDAYQHQYVNSYVEYVGATPKQAFVDDVAVSMTAQQKDAVNKMALNIQSEGCNSRTTKYLRRYVQALQEEDAKPIVDPSTVERKVQNFKKK